MIGKSPQHSFQRRLVACYLLFCMVAVAWLSAGVLFTAQTVLQSRTTSSCLSRLGQLAAAIEIDQLRNGGANLQSLTERAQHDGRLLYCCIVSSGGRYRTHTTKPLVGAPVVEPQGKHLRWGNIDGVQYVDVQSRIVSEYRVALTASSQPIGTLRLAVADPDFFSVATDVAKSAPISLLLPLACVGVGALFVGRLAKPMADLESLLASVAACAPDEAPKLEPTTPQSAASAGWNRLVAYVRTLQQRAGADNSESRLAEALAARGAGASTSALDSLRDGIAVTDAQGRLEFANSAIAGLLGDLGGSEMSASDLEALIASSAGSATADDDQNKPTVVEAPAPGAPDERTLRIERQPQQGASGRGHVWCVRDITQQKLAQQSRDDFINAATHELRTPLSNIKAYAETLASCDFNDVEQQKGFCNTINSEATRLARFVDDLLDISSLEVGSLSVQRQNVDLERMIREAAENVRPLMESKSLRFGVNLGPKLGEMQMDKDKVSAMVVNLLGNAAKYTPDGGEVTLTAVAGENGVTVEIADSGLGIAAEELPRVFEKFFRSENPEVADQIGTGLGLPLAREIARLHGGDITAESTLGEGSTFTIQLPPTAGRSA